MHETDFPEFEQARLGQTEAIAHWLRCCLASASPELSVERQGSRLSVTLHGLTEPDPRQWVPWVVQHLQALPHGARTVTIVGYRVGSPVPLWSQQIELTAATDPATPSWPTSQPEPLPLPNAPHSLVDRFLVCGLGSLGQYVVYTLKQFSTPSYHPHITAIDRAMPTELEVPQLLDMLAETPIIDDCRSEPVLLRAGVQQCRTVLIVTSNESVNIETAIAARRLNPAIRLVVRSSRQSLNQLLKQRLDNFVAFEPTELPAQTFALAGLNAGILGSFSIGPCRLQVVEHLVPPQDYRFDGFLASNLHKKTLRLLSYRPTATEPSALPPTRAFYHWQPETRIHAGDTVAFIEWVEQGEPPHPPDPTGDPNPLQALGEALRRWLTHALAHGPRVWQWVQAQQARQVIAVGVLTALLLWIVGTVMLKSAVPEMSWQKAIASGAILLLGGYGDLFGGLDNDPVPGWVQFAGLLITLLSFLFVLGGLGLLAESLLSARFDFLKKRLPIPQRHHVVLVGLGRLGQRVATLLREFKQPLVAITEQTDHHSLPESFPILTGDVMTHLARVNLASAKSIMVLTDDQMLNLEVALMARNLARQADRDIGLVIRAYNQRFSDNLADLLPDARVLAAYALAGEAFAGAAFGENILALFRLNNQTILVTEYSIAEDDTLVGKLLAEVAYGYHVVPIFHQRQGADPKTETSEFLMPSDDRRLQVGDRLIVLASINGLRRIEHNDITPPHRWQLHAQKPLNDAFLHYIGNDLARISGCSLDEARSFMKRLPGVMELALYDHQAHRLQQELGRQLPLTLERVDNSRD